MTFVIKESWAKLAFLGSIAVAVAGTIVSEWGPSAACIWGRPE